MLSEHIFSDIDNEIMKMTGKSQTDKQNSSGNELKDIFVDWAIINYPNIEFNSLPHSPLEIVCNGKRYLACVTTRGTDNAKAFTVGIERVINAYGEKEYDSYKHKLNGNDLECKWVVIFVYGHDDKVDRDNVLVGFDIQYGSDVIKSSNCSGSRASTETCIQAVSQGAGRYYRCTSNDLTNASTIPFDDWINELQAQNGTDEQVEQNVV